MANTNEVVINGVVYEPKSAPRKRYVVVVNHGWIYAGDLEESNGRILLRNAVWVFSWNSIGFASVIENPKQSNVDIRKCAFDVDIPSASEVYRIPVCDGWGL